MEGLKKVVAYPLMPAGVICFWFCGLQGNDTCNFVLVLSSRCVLFALVFRGVCFSGFSCCTFSQVVNVMFVQAYIG